MGQKRLLALGAARTPASGSGASLMLGCFERSLFPEVSRSALVLAPQLAVPGCQGCCGALHAHNGEPCGVPEPRTLVVPAIPAGRRMLRARLSPMLGQVLPRLVGVAQQPNEPGYRAKAGELGFAEK